MREQKFLDQLSCKISEIMRKKKLNGRLAAILDFISAKFVMGYHCVRPSILFYIHGSAICIFLSHLNITKSLKFKMAAKRPFLFFAPKRESGHWLT